MGHSGMSLTYIYQGLYKILPQKWFVNVLKSFVKAQKWFVKSRTKGEEIFDSKLFS